MITLEDAKKHLRVLHSNEDELIQIYISAALSRFCEFTGRTLYATQEKLDEDVDAPLYTQVMNDEIRAGCLILIAHLYVHRSENAEIPQAIGYLWQSYWVPMIS